MVLERGELVKKNRVVKIGLPDGVIAIVGVPNNDDINKLSEQIGKPIRKIEKRNKTILLIGDGLLKQRVVFHHSG